MFIPIPFLILLFLLWLLEDDIRRWVGKKLIKMKYKTFVPYHKRRAKDECDFVNIQMKLERKQFAELN